MSQAKEALLDKIESILLKEMNEMKAGAELSSKDFASEKAFNHIDVLGVASSLSASKFIVNVHMPVYRYGLSETATDTLLNGSVAFQLYQMIKQKGGECKKSDIKDNLAAGFGGCMKNRWIRHNKKTGILSIVAENPVDVDKKSCLNLKDILERKSFTAVSKKGLEKVLLEKYLEDKEDKNVKKAKKEISQFKPFLTINNESYVTMTKGEEFALVRVKPVAALTTELIRSGDYQTTLFSEYNFNAKGKKLKTGALHPLMKVKAEVRKILLNMGFEEMPTDRYVENSFYNFDTLFVPQHHPARDSHDTFFLSNPATSDIDKDILASNPNYLQKVIKVHEKGAKYHGADSVGWRYKFSKEETSKNILRTHTTAISSRMLNLLAEKTKKQNKWVPQRYFSIDRVFRNETVDANHLAEFHQVEGLVADKNIGLGDLLGVIAEFFKRAGIPNIKFKPAYNPYTEPSMEIFGWDTTKQKWLEIGNSGVFRPEMLGPMGLPDDVRIIAWGLGLERQTMIKYGIRSIRTLFGHKVDVNMVKSNPICRF